MRKIRVLGLALILFAVSNVVFALVSFPDTDSQSYWGGSSPFGVVETRIGSEGLNITLLNNGPDTLELQSIKFSENVSGRIFSSNATIIFGPGERKSIDYPAPNMCTGSRYISFGVEIAYKTSSGEENTFSGIRPLVVRCPEETLPFEMRFNRFIAFNWPMLMLIGTFVVLTSIIVAYQIVKHGKFIADIMFWAAMVLVVIISLSVYVLSFPYPS